MKPIRKAFFIILFVFLCTSVTYPFSIDELGKSTVYLREQMVDEEIKGGKKYEIWLKDITNQKLEPKIVNKLSGTGFLIPHNRHIYLVTAAHIARKLSNKAEIIWNAASGKSRKFTLEELQKGLPDSKWFFHPSADMAVHPFGFTEKSEHILIPEELFIADNDVIPLGTKIYVLGFPLNLGVKDFLSPISKKAEIASWITTIDDPQLLPDLKYILLDDALAGGYSGSPVFVSPELQMPQKPEPNVLFALGRVKLIGIQSMTISDKTGGKISLVVPIFYLNDIFKSDDFKQYEKQVGIK